MRLTMGKVSLQKTNLSFASYENDDDVSKTSESKKKDVEDPSPK
jgi:hypothetical protein